jgi:hypothetical protein
MAEGRADYTFRCAGLWATSAETTRLAEAVRTMIVVPSGTEPSERVQNPSLQRPDFRPVFTVPPRCCGAGSDSDVCDPASLFGVPEECQDSGEIVWTSRIEERPTEACPYWRRALRAGYPYYATYTKGPPRRAALCDGRLRVAN